MEKIMQAAVKRIAIATPIIACATLLSLSWSEHGSISLRVEIAEARADRPSPSNSVAGVARRQHRRPVNGSGVLAAAVAATTSSWNYNDYYCYDAPYAARRAPDPGYYTSYPGGYCVNNSNLTGLYARPTLFPRFYVGWDR
jgi:hypothetical protein